MSRVFIVQDDGTRDLSDAARFGALVTVFFKDVYPDEVDEKMPSLRERAEKVLDDFSYDYDYLCLVGAPLFMALCVSVLEYGAGLEDGETGGGSVRMPVRILRFDRKERAYYPISLG